VLQNFTSLAIEDVYSISIVQQCRMLKSQLGTDTVAKYLHNPPPSCNPPKRIF